MTDASSYEILICNEIWDCETDTFDHRAILLRRDGQYFSACDPRRNGPIDQSQLSLEPIPVAQFRAPFTADLTLAPDTCLQSKQVYIKEPQLIDYSMSSAAEKNTFYEPQLQEVQVYELLRLNPHPNIGLYYGCVVKDNRILGLSLRRYSYTLKDAIREKKPSFDQRRAYLEDVKRGIAHLHNLGLVHGDLNPSNIMVDENCAVLIDFDSCRPAGKPMGRKGGTWEWCPDEIPDTAELEHDQAALKKLEEYLLGAGSDTTT
ncbi:LIM domain kinase 1 [Tolypocladium ophioglossoides CBS 100239]|uniref:LIM domain kinase 1 n=1 Tax=Tolypocladium ophioglossoides (strain CBS 100239) TaxID=1163406 RepID=A0A0L0NEW8_TOLOC|nr:LIM domain kinase 1 [Tolypocladium ophioglossoides CBS 100239]